MIIHGQWAVVVVAGGCELVMVVGGGSVVLWSLWPSRHIADGDVAPASRVSKGRGRVRWLTCIHVDSDDDLHRHCLDNVACPLTCHIVLIPSKRCSCRCCRPSLLFLSLLPSLPVVPSVWLVTWHCHVVVVVGVVERSWDVVMLVVVETKRRWSMMVVEKKRN